MRLSVSRTEFFSSLRFALLLICLTLLILWGLTALTDAQEKTITIPGGSTPSKGVLSQSEWAVTMPASSATDGAVLLWDAPPCSKAALLEALTEAEKEFVTDPNAGDILFVTGSTGITYTLGWSTLEFKSGPSPADEKRIKAKALMAEADEIERRSAVAQKIRRLLADCSSKQQ